MVRARKWWAAKNHTIIIWLSSGILSLFLFKMASRNMATDNLNPNIPAEPILDYSKQRTELYENMSRDLYEHGAAFLARGETSQSLSLSDLFTLKNGKVTPVLKAADPPVRATVLYLSPKFSEPIAQTVKKVFLPDFGTAIWFQNASLYHFSMFHASHHIEPVLATAEEVDSEARAVQAVSRKICPLRIKLERVVLTSTGVLLGCWQVTNGTDPVIIRSELRKALPRSPKKQLYNPVMLHTSFARLLGRPQAKEKELYSSNDMLSFLKDLVARVNDELHGYVATVSDIWFVEEFDVLALALDGKIKPRQFPLECFRS